MNTAASSRSSVALLLLCVLALDALLIGIGRGHASVLALSGLQGGYCSMLGHAGPAVSFKDHESPVSKMPLAGCSFCGAAGGLPVAGWRYDPSVVSGGAYHPALRQSPQAFQSPWPMANPRASPVAA